MRNPRVVMAGVVRVRVQKGEKIGNAISKITNSKKKRIPADHTFHHIVNITPKTKGVRQLTIHWEYRPNPS